MDPSEEQKSNPLSPSQDEDAKGEVEGGVVDSNQFTITRRKVIIGSAALGVGMMGACVGYQFRNELANTLRRLASGDNSSTSPDTQNQSTRKPYNPIPNTATVKAYRKFLAKNPVQYLSPNELLRPHFKTRGGVCSGIPPEKLWGNMIVTVRVADEIRRRLGVPLHTVASAYRSPQYNAKCPGASKYSQHMHNRALDLVYACPPREAFDVANQLRQEGFFKGGIGLYSNFIHIDTRGRNATWGS